MTQAFELSLTRRTSRCGCTDQRPGTRCIPGRKLFASVQRQYARTVGTPPSCEEVWASYEISRRLYYLHLGETPYWGKYPLPSGRAQEALLYSLDEEDIGVVIHHSLDCARCHVAYLSAMRGDWLVKVADMCLEIRAYLESQGEQPHQGVEIVGDGAERMLAYEHLLIKEDIQEIEVAELSDRYFFLPSGTFVISSVKDFVTEETIRVSGASRKTNSAARPE